jgi:hypothetical protein
MEAGSLLQLFARLVGAVGIVSTLVRRTVVAGVVVHSMRHRPMWQVPLRRWS